MRPTWSLCLVNKHSFGDLGMQQGDMKEFGWFAGLVSDGWEKMRWHLKFVNHFLEKQTNTLVFVFIVVFQCSAERTLFRIMLLECTSVFLFLFDSYHLFLQILVFAVFWHSQVPSAEYYLSYLQIAEFWSEGRRMFWSQLLWNQSISSGILNPIKFFWN